jgi:hypothetical protein
VITPCPICQAPYGFHDEAPHDARSIPADKLLPLTSEQRAAVRADRWARYLDWLRAQPADVQQEHTARDARIVI